MSYNLWQTAKPAARHRRLAKWILNIFTKLFNLIPHASADLSFDFLTLSKTKIIVSAREWMLYQLQLSI